jgi:serine/threonine-protein kinase RsbW
MMNNHVPGLRITLPAKPANVAVVRHAVAGLAEQLGMGEPAVGDLKTVVTEACMNVVVHAYEDGTVGPLDVEAVPEDDGLTVCVRDSGAGIRPRPDIENPSLRIGLTLIAALSQSFEISGGLGRGTEVKMHLALKPPEGEIPPATIAPDPVPEETALTIGRPDLAASVLERVVGALAARHAITVDRLSDAMLLTDAVSARAGEAFEAGRLRFAVADQAEGIDLRIGPMPEGASRRLLDGLALPQVGGSLETLADELRVERDEEGEYVVVRFAALTS